VVWIMGPMALSRDARLVARIRRGDSSAFEALHARHQPAVLAFCRHLTGNLEDAEDAVQHTFLAAYRRIVDSPDDLELRPWLFAVARNRSLSLLRARRAVPDLDAAPAPFDGLAVEVERRQELRDLVSDMSRLPEPQRAALVLSQLDALSYREIGSVLEVPPEKVKALVFQARSSLASTREAREAPCFEIRSEIATARGSGLRRRLLRRHVGQCDGCREFEVTVMRQRRELAILLPVAPSAGLGPSILEGALGREGATATAGLGGAAAAATGGVGSGGLAGTLAVLGSGGAAKLAVVAAMVGGGATGAVAADLPARIQATAAIGGADRADTAGEVAGPRVGGEDAPDEARPEGADGRGRADGQGGAGPDKDSPRSDATETASRDARVGLPGTLTGGAAPDAEMAEPDDPGAADGEEPGPGTGPGSVGEDHPPGLPPGLAKRDELPHGLAKRDELPPGLAKGGGTSGKSGGQGQGNAGGNGNGNGGGQGNPGAGQGKGNGGNGQGNGNPAAGQGNGGSGGGDQAADGDLETGQGDAAPAPTGADPGTGGGNGNGQGNAGAGQGNGNAGGNGNGGQSNGNAGNGRGT
jgi:RNA polymerase sigma factor (sigma-70 family)